MTNKKIRKKVKISIITRNQVFVSITKIHSARGHRRVTPTKWATNTRPCSGRGSAGNALKSRTLFAPPGNVTPSRHIFFLFLVLLCHRRRLVRHFFFCDKLKTGDTAETLFFSLSLLISVLGSRFHWRPPSPFTGRAPYSNTAAIGWCRSRRKKRRRFGIPFVRCRAALHTGRPLFACARFATFALLSAIPNAIDWWITSLLYVHATVMCI